MRRRLVNQFLAAFLAVIAGAPMAPRAATADDADKTLPQLAAQWRRLRALKGHFDGAPWSDEVDRWGGAKHQTLMRIAQLLVSRRAALADVEATLGRPDAVVRQGAPDHDRMLAAMSRPSTPEGSCPQVDSAEAADFWLYRWRGQHDQVALVLRQGRVVGCGWLLDWE